MSNQKHGYRRAQFEILRGRLLEPRRFIQVLAGPRQCGKTTLARQVAEALPLPVQTASADGPALRGAAWLEEAWEAARLRARETAGGSLLVVDEIQKVPGWAEAVKRLWDQDAADDLPLKVLLLGSAPWLLQRGLTESLTGRFELVRLTHWQFDEMRRAFGWDLDRYLCFGGYPGAAALADDVPRWKSYIGDSIIETTVSRDLLLATRVDKPALLRQLFHLGCAYSGQILSYQKMMGQLQDAGNTTTLAHYLDLLEAAGLLTGLRKFSGEIVRQRGSSPKLLVLNNALLFALSEKGLDDARADSEFLGRLAESAVGAHIANGAAGLGIELFYWREGNLEVDYVIRRGRSITAVEVKSGRRRDRLPGMEAFAKRFQPQRLLLVGSGGLSLKEFLCLPPDRLFA